MRSWGALVAWSAGDVALARLPWPWCAACLIGWAIGGMALLLWAGAGALSRAVSHQRHRWANHQQLVAGWLELGRPDEAARIVAGAGVSAPWLVPLPGWAKLAVWWLDARADAAGVALTWPQQPSTARSLARALFFTAAALDALGCARLTGTVAVEAGAEAYGVRVAADGPPKRTTWYFWGVRFQVGYDAERWQWQERPHAGRMHRGG
ncbi:MAG: Spo0B domain-containing protein [Thermaerobacter sp.]|nr:Spo0B domain-containing protein [Thermaerobacter sp.]